MRPHDKEERKPGPLSATSAQQPEDHSEEDAAERALFGEDEARPAPKEAQGAPVSAPEVKTEVVEPDQPAPLPAPVAARSRSEPDLASQLFPPDSPRRLASQLFPSHSPSRSRFSESQPPHKRPNLGEMAQLVADLVRNREEKVAIAVGAYNNVS